VKPDRGEWIANEPVLARTAIESVGTLFRRARASWPIWAAVALLASAGATFHATLRPAPYETTVVLSFSEGGAVASDAEGPVSVGALRTYITDLAFSRVNLLALAGKHPAAFPQLAVDPDRTLMTMRDAMRVTVTGDDFIDDYGGEDGPRPVRIEVAYQSKDPLVSAAVARDLARLLGDAEAARQKRELERQTAVGASMGLRVDGPDPDKGTAATAWLNLDQDLGKGIGQVRRKDAGKPGAGAGRAGDPAAKAGAVSGGPSALRMYKRLGSARRQVELARLTLHAIEQSQYLKFDVVDPGQAPTPRTLNVGRTVTLLLGFLLLFIPALALLAGAFDPRVLDRADLAATPGAVVLGRLPRPKSRVY
jgi:hypothetical protein